MLRFLTQGQRQETLGFYNAYNQAVAGGKPTWTKRIKPISIALRD